MLFISTNWSQGRGWKTCVCVFLCIFVAVSSTHGQGESFEEMISCKACAQNDKRFSPALTGKKRKFEKQGMRKSNMHIIPELCACKLKKPPVITGLQRHALQIKI